MALSPPAADPAQVVAAERAFAAAAQSQGQWTAFAAFATHDAWMFVPQPVNAQEFLRDRANPQRAVAWQPHQVWTSCDGTLAFSRGAWQRPDGSVGYFTTLWQRQEDGSYRWLLDQGDTLPRPLVEPAQVETTVAACPAPGEAGAAVGLASLVASEPEGTPEGRDFSFHSPDSTLYLHFTVATDLSRHWRLYLWSGSAMVEVTGGQVSGPEG